LHRRALLKLFGIETGLALFAPGLSGCSSPVPDRIKIGVLVALTGSAGPRGVDLLRGAQLAAEELNRTPLKVRGRPVVVEIVSFDDKGENEAAAVGAKHLLAEGVIGIVGPLGTPQGLKAIPVIAQSGHPHLFTMTAAHLHTLSQGNTFRLLANDELQARAAASFVSETLKARTVVSVYEAGEYGNGLNTVFSAAFENKGGKVAQAWSLDAKAEVSAQIAQAIKAQQAEVIMLFSRDPHLNSLFKVLKDVGHTDVVVVGSNVIRNKNVASRPIPVRELYATATAIDAKEYVNGASFLSAFEAKYKEPPLWGAHYGYDAVLALAGAVAATESVDSKKLIERLKTREPRTRVVDQMRFEASGELKYASIAIYHAQRGTWQLQMRSSQW
jgi:branched-chain amino acid transport system substrate-binding protein